VIRVVLLSLIMNNVHLRRLWQYCVCRKFRQVKVKVFKLGSFNSAMKSASIFWSARMCMDPEVKSGSLTFLPPLRKATYHMPSYFICFVTYRQIIIHQDVI
jgi:hypothetical protein